MPQIHTFPASLHSNRPSSARWSTFPPECSPPMSLFPSSFPLLYLTPSLVLPSPTRWLYVAMHLQAVCRIVLWVSIWQLLIRERASHAIPDLIFFPSSWGDHLASFGGFFRFFEWPCMKVYYSNDFKEPFHERRKCLSVIIGSLMIMSSHTALNFKAPLSEFYGHSLSKVHRLSNSHASKQQPVY